MRMKKNCDGCKALDTDSNGAYLCDLRYKMAQDIGFSYTNPRPLEICPKPKKFDEYNKLYNKIHFNE